MSLQIICWYFFISQITCDKSICWVCSFHYQNQHCDQPAGPPPQFLMFATDNPLCIFRFASFIEGSSHLLDEEILEYETSIQDTDLTDDEEFTDEEN